MSTKTDRVRPMDLVRGTAGAGSTLESAGSTVAPAQPTPPAPTELAVISNTVGRSSASAIAIVGLQWRPPDGSPVRTYQVEIATDSAFTAIYRRDTSTMTSARIELPTSRTFYIRVYAQAAAMSAPSNVVTLVTADDTTAAGVPTSASAAFIGSGDLQVTWSNPASENLRDVEVKIWNASAKTTLYHTGYSANGRYIWTAAQNRSETSGTPDASVYVELRSRTWASVMSTAVVVGTITKAVPATPAGLSADFSGPDCVINWTVASDAAFYRLSLDGVAQPNIAGGRYVYPLDLNRQQHSGTPDPVLSLSLVAVDALDQVSTAATATATNAAPPAPASVTATGGFSAFMASVSATEPPDFLTYRWRLIQTSPSAGDITWDDRSTLQTRNVTAAATYQVGVKIVDVFGQLSTEVLSSTFVLDALTLADLRLGVRYSDSLATAAATLKAALADDNKASGGVSYASNASWVRWIRAERDLLERYRTITLAQVPASGTTSWYLRTSIDGTTWSYFAGPVTSSRILTAVADATAAQTAAVSAATLGGASTTRVDLPTIVEARYVELWLRNTTASTRVDEFYPRRLVQADDVEAESLRAIHMAAASITADRLSVLQLSAITADMGSLTAGTITGAIIRTAASGARVELNSGAAGGLIGYGASDTYNAATGTGTYQLHWRLTDGQLYAGAGAIRLGSFGIRAITPAGYADAPSFGFYDATNSVYTGALQGRNNGNNWLQLITNARASVSSYLDLKAEATTSGTEAQSRLWAQRSSAIAEVIAKATTGGLGRVEINADQVVINQGITVGSVNSSGTLTGTALQTSNGGFNMSPRGAHIGSTTTDYIPSSGGDWPANTTLLLNFADHAAIGFHDSGNRVDFITMTGGIMSLGYNAGWGAANISIPGQRVGIGMGNTTVPTATTLNVRSHTTSSGENVLNIQNSTPTNLLTIRSDGGQNSSIVNWTITSDQDAKRNVRDLDMDEGILDALRPRRYNLRWDGDDEPERFGFVAQDFLKHPQLAKLVRSDLETGQLGIIYDGVLPILVAQLRRALRRIQALEARIP